MPGTVFKVSTALVVVLGAVLYQIEFPRIMSVILGLDRKLEPLSDFPFTCRRLYHDRIKACEDMWLSESTRQLFLACSDPLSREEWSPAMAKFNYSGRNLDDAIVVLDVDELAANKDVKPRILATPNFPGTAGDGRLHLQGMAGVDDQDGNVRLWIINIKPSVNATTGEFLDHSKVGANFTVELFRTARQAKTLEYVKTFAHPQVSSPNRITAAGGDKDAFYFTNDHGTVKTGLTHHLSPLLGTGDVSFCDDTNCRQVASGLKFPNGLTKGLDGLIYVPSSVLGMIYVYQPQPNGDLVKIDTIDGGYALDNLSVDRDGDIFAAAFPDSFKFFASSRDPYNKDTPATALKVTKKAEGGYEVTKAIEDGLGQILPGATTVIHDSASGRLFLSGVFAPYIAVCEPK